MDYWASITVPKTTPILSPTREVLRVCPGIIKHVWLFFPKGHVGTTKVRILRFEHQVWPTNLDAWYLGDGTVIEFPENYPLDIEPYEFVIEGYNTSVNHSHTTYLRFTILAEEKAFVPMMPRRVEVTLW